MIATIAVLVYFLCWGLERIFQIDLGARPENVAAVVAGLGYLIWRGVLTSKALEEPQNSKNTHESATDAIAFLLLGTWAAQLTSVGLFLFSFQLWGICLFVVAELTTAVFFLLIGLELRKDKTVKDSEYLIPMFMMM